MVYHTKMLLPYSNILEMLNLIIKNSKKIEIIIFPNFIHIFKHIKMSISLTDDNIKWINNHHYEKIKNI